MKDLINKQNSAAKKITKNQNIHHVEQHQIKVENYNRISSTQKQDVREDEFQ